MSKKITFCAMMAGLGILSLLASVIFSSNTIFFYLFSTLFTYICNEEYGKKYGILTFAVITLAGFAIVPNKVSMGLYAMVGYYPVIKHIIEHFEIPRPAKTLLKIVFASLVGVIAYFIFRQFVVLELAVGVVFLVAIILFVLYDIALTVGIKFYALRLRKFR